MVLVEEALVWPVDAVVRTLGPLFRRIKWGSATCHSTKQHELHEGGDRKHVFVQSENLSSYLYSWVYSTIYI